MQITALLVDLLRFWHFSYASEISAKTFFYRNPHICGRIIDMVSTSLPSRACIRMYSENTAIRLGSPQNRAAWFSFSLKTVWDGETTWLSLIKIILLFRQLFGCVCTVPASAKMFCRCKLGSRVCLGVDVLANTNNAFSLPLDARVYCSRVTCKAVC